jgi:membrane protease subunit HflC
MKKNPLTFVIGLLLIVIVGLLLFTFQVRQSEVAVVTTFGKPSGAITEAGAKWKLPWPIQRVYKFDQRVQNFAEDKLTQGQTQDGFVLLTSVYVGWKITDPQGFFPRFAWSPEPIAEAERVLERTVANAKQAVVGKHALLDFLSPAEDGNKFAAIENELLTAVQTEVRSNSYGLEIAFLGIKKLGLPENVTQSVFDQMTKERQVLISKIESEGTTEAEIKRSGAKRRAAEMVAKAEGEARMIRGEGMAQAAKSLAIFEENPELAKFLFGLEALEGSLKERSILIFDQHTPPFNLLGGVSTNLFNKETGGGSKKAK